MTYKAKKKKNIVKQIFVWLLVLAMTASVVGPIIYYIVAA